MKVGYCQLFALICVNSIKINIYVNKAQDVFLFITFQFKLKQEQKNK